MAKELQAAQVLVGIFGVNEVGYEDTNDLMCDGVDLPWLQDTSEVSLWGGLWAVNYRDVIIVDTEGQYLETFNLSGQSLADHYDELKGKLEAHALAQ